MGDNIAFINVGDGLTVTSVACSETWTSAILSNGQIKSVGGCRISLSLVPHLFAARPLHHDRADGTSGRGRALDQGSICTVAMTEPGRVSTRERCERDR
jgi:hypothetical protein